MAKYLLSVTIPKEWVAESAIKQFNHGAVLWGNFWYYLKYTVFPIITYVVLCDKPATIIDLAPGLLVSGTFAILFSFYQYYKWNNSTVSASMAYSYVATLDDDGVEITYVNNSLKIKWSNYKSTKMNGNRLELIDQKGAVTYVPINEETDAAIKFTQQRIALINTPPPNESLHRTVK